jgi:dGTPase
VRVVERLEKGGAGLNLTWEVRNGIVCHTKGTPAATLEGQLVRLADHIAYINHDIEDALRGDIIRPLDIPLEISNVLGFTHSKRISTLVTDAVQASQGQREICQSPRVGEAMLALKDFMFESVYTNQLAKGEEGKAQDMLRRLFEYYQKDPDRLPGDFQTIRMEEGVDRAVCDYIAGMTDPFAVERFKELFIPKGWTVL